MDEAADSGLVGRLREALVAAGYEYDAVTALLGPTAHAALSRNETTPALRATRGGTALETLVRLWLLQAPVPAVAADAALPGLVDPLCAAGILRRSIGEVAAAVDLRPYATETGNLWIASDLTPGLDGGPARVGARHVLGISSASTSLAQLTVREPVGRALDLGTGCGVQALHLAAHAGHVVATDLNPRALWLAGLNAELNGVPTGSTTGGIELREGSFFEPVAGETFDLVVSNPPFVISPGTGERLVYRDSGLPGDRVVEHVVRTARQHLLDGGTCQILANWMILRDQPWEERLSGWLEGCDAWVVQREVADPPSYVELWLKDAGLHGAADYRQRYDTWLSWFDEQGAEAVGFGWINLRRVSKDSTTEVVRRLEEWPWQVAQPLGDEVAAHFARLELLRRLDDRALVAVRPRLRSDVVQEAHGRPGAEDPAEIVLRQQTGMRRGRQVDTATAALLGACDGDLALGQLLGAVEQLTGGSVPLSAVRELVTEGYLILA